MCTRTISYLALEEGHSYLERSVSRTICEGFVSRENGISHNTLVLREALVRYRSRISLGISALCIWGVCISLFLRYHVFRDTEIQLRYKLKYLGRKEVTFGQKRSHTPSAAVRR